MSDFLIFVYICLRRFEGDGPVSFADNRNKLMKALDQAGWPDRFPAKEHCSKCGLCETTFVENVTDACAFLNEGMSRIDYLEEIGSPILFPLKSCRAPIAVKK